PMAGRSRGGGTRLTGHVHRAVLPLLHGAGVVESRLFAGLATASAGLAHRGARGGSALGPAGEQRPVQRGLSQAHRRPLDCGLRSLLSRTVLRLIASSFGSSLLLESTR